MASTLLILLIHRKAKGAGKGLRSLLHDLHWIPVCTEGLEAHWKTVLVVSFK